MTVAPSTPRLSFDSVEDALLAVRGRGLRVSTARRLLLQALFAAEGPVSAERIARGLGMEPTSVYRNLETLERHGLLRHVHLGHGPGLYVLVGHGEQEYLYCEQCGAVRAVTPEQLDSVRAEIRRAFGYDARFTHFAIVGLCPRCAEEREAADQLSEPSGQVVKDGHEHRHEHRHDQPPAARSHEHSEPQGHTRHDLAHSHGDHVHSHPHPHRSG